MICSPQLRSGLVTTVKYMSGSLQLIADCLNCEPENLPNVSAKTILLSFWRKITVWSFIFLLDDVKVNENVSWASSIFKRQLFKIRGSKSIFEFLERYTEYESIQLLKYILKVWSFSHLLGSDQIPCITSSYVKAKVRIFLLSLFKKSLVPTMLCSNAIHTTCLDDNTH